MPSKRKRSGPDFNRDAPVDSTSAFKRSKPAYNQVYRLPSRNISGPGIFATCVQSKERKAALQFIDLLNEVADRIYPGVAPQPLPEVEEKKDAIAAVVDEEDMDALRNGAVAETAEQPPQPVQEEVEKQEETPKEVAEGDDDIAAQIAAELKDIKSSERSRGPNSKKGNSGPAPRFRNVETDTECFLFISVSPPFDPYRLVYTILSDVELSGEPRSRFVQRLTPVTTTCAANAADLTSLAHKILPPFFSTNPEEGKTFKIDSRIRSHSKLKRNDVIQTIAAAIPTDAEGKRIHNANLTAPDYWIVVEVVKNSAAISVVKDYERYKKMNLQSVAQAANEKKAGQSERGDQGRIAASLVAKSEAKQPEPDTEKVDEEEAPQLSEPETAASTTETAPEQNDEQQMANFRLF
ncbi:related to TAN1-putative tRNA acetyltransferase [Sporisorium scitamineum]|uniref:Related to TAN1-putative tRNA acetyltransferase n=1 Tax=Sporisorium scitamineum TaxID=49012 RepID=A0A0F7S8B5_9BASI|nr:related to TAN1-putative tRNA acetyltransferase [Sporisorium scitamineum]CDW99192.1 hypothetical protein [Sporisorium scitamineum]